MNWRMDNQEMEDSMCYIIPEEVRQQLYDKGIEWSTIIKKAVESVGDKVCTHKK